MKTALLIFGAVILLGILFTTEGRDLVKKVLKAIFDILAIPFRLLENLGKSAKPHVPENMPERPDAAEVLCTILGLCAVVANVFLLFWSLGTIIPSLSTLAVVFVAILICLLEILAGILFVEAKKRRLPFMTILSFLMLLAFCVAEAMLSIERTKAVTNSQMGQIAIGIFSFLTPLVCGLALGSLAKTLHYTLSRSQRGVTCLCNHAGEFGTEAIEKTAYLTETFFEMIVVTCKHVEFGTKKALEKWHDEGNKRHEQENDQDKHFKDTGLLCFLLCALLSLGGLGCRHILPEQAKGRQVYVLIDISGSFAYCGNSVEKTKQIMERLSGGDEITVHTIGNLGFVPAALVLRAQFPVSENQFNLNDKALKKERERLINILQQKISCNEKNKSAGTYLVSAILYVASLLQNTRTPQNRRYVILFSDMGNTEKDDMLSKNLQDMKLPRGCYFVLNFLCLGSANCTYERKMFWIQWFKARGVTARILLPEESSIGEIFPVKKQAFF